MENYAFTTLLATDDYLWGAVCLYQSLQIVNSKYPFHLLVTDNISLKTRNILDEIGILYTIVPRIDFMNQENRYFVTFNKFHIYTLTQYDAVCFIDCDAIVKTNIDDVFSNTAPGFMVLNDRFLSGVLVLVNPKSKTLQDFESYREECSADEQVWNKIYDPSKVTDLSEYMYALIHRTDVFNSDDKYWKYYQLDSMEKVLDYLHREYESDFQLTFKACEIAHNKWLLINNLKSTEIIFEEELVDEDEDYRYSLDEDV